MLFSSLTFLFVFFPCVLIGYFLIFRKSLKLQNVFLTFSSLLFYAWGEPLYVFLMIFSIIVNWLLAIRIVESLSKKTKRIYLITAIFINMSNLFIFKYLDFAVTNINKYMGFNINIVDIALPIGISFYSFQAMSYVIDVYRNEKYIQKSIINVALYISLFPQLIAGPIVRYNTIAEQIRERTINSEKFGDGVNRFTIGLFKKVMIANNVALLADHVFNELNILDFPFYVYWLGAIAYMLQIYFDFSGYSDMAIGLGKMFGFDFLENFKYPYISKSISEFWQRWHISLGSWFRDYLYFPLGGSKVKTRKRLIMNLSVVWLFTGIWHGANWTFIIWGIYHAFFVILEKLVPKIKFKNPILSVLSTLVIILFGWILFRADSISLAKDYVIKMLSFTSLNGLDTYTEFLINRTLPFILIGMLFSVPTKDYIEKLASKNIISRLIYMTSFVMILSITVAWLVKSSYNPFIYFNF